MAKKKLDLQAILDNPEQLADLQKKAMYKRIHDKRMATFAANPDIIKKRTATYLATLAANPEIKKKRVDSRNKTMAANPDIQKRLTEKIRARSVNYPKEWLRHWTPEFRKKMGDNMKARLGANPDIIQKRRETRAKTMAAKDPKVLKEQGIKRGLAISASISARLKANPDIFKNSVKKRKVTLAKKQALHTPYGVFITRSDAANHLLGQYGFSKNKGSAGNKIGKLIKTNPKEWYWVKKA